MPAYLNGKKLDVVCLNGHKTAAYLNGVKLWPLVTPPTVYFVDCAFSTTYPLTRSVSSSNPGYLLTTGLIKMNGGTNFPFFGQQDCVYQDKTVEYGGKTCYVYKSNMSSWQGSKSSGEILNWGTSIPSGTQFVADASGNVVIFDEEP